MNLFLSYNFKDESFIQQVSYYLRKQQNLKPYCYADAGHFSGWVAEVGQHLSNSNAFLLFSGRSLGEIQMQEAVTAVTYKAELQKSNVEFRLLRIELPEAAPLPPELMLFATSSPEPVRVGATDEDGARDCAKKITETLLGKGEWVNVDYLPIGYPFDYEKKIIEEYSKGDLPGELLSLGCPKEWPRVTKQVGKVENQVSESEIGLYRDWDHKQSKRREKDPQVVVAALTDYHTDGLISRSLTLPEAGPRKYLYYPRKASGALTVGVMVSGGIAPGINAVIAGIVGRQFLYAEKGDYEETLTVNGYYNGLNALLREGMHEAVSLDPGMVANHANLGGSILGTSRAHGFMEKNPARLEQKLRSAVTRLSGHGTEILYIIGGDGSMRIAHALWKTAQDMGTRLSVVGIPKTMDNDILWVWQSFGFLSAVEWSKEAIQQLHTEAKSNPRLCVIQLFGSDSGFVVTHAVTASGVCDLFLIPEVPFKMQAIADYITRKLIKRYKRNNRISAYGVVVMAETAIPLDAEAYMDDPDIGLSDEEKQEIRLFLGDKKRRLFGQTPDALRSGGLKLVSRVLQKFIRSMAGEYWQDFRVFTNEPRHLIRAIPPSSSDIIFAHRLGSLAVDCAMAGYTDFMISQWLTEYVMVPLSLVTLGRKRIPKDGIFYKSARSSTGQPAELE